MFLLQNNSSSKKKKNNKGSRRKHCKGMDMFMAQMVVMVHGYRFPHVRYISIKDCLYIYINIIMLTEHILCTNMPHALFHLTLGETLGVRCQVIIPT